MDYPPTYDKSDKDEEDYKSTNKQPDTTNTPELASEESVAQKEQGLKILTPQQMLSRLPISLAQLKA